MSQLRLLTVDYDGVVADTNSVKATWIRNHLRLEIPPSSCNRTECVPLIGIAAYEQMSSEVYDRSATLHAPEVVGVRQALAALSAQWRLMLVTARSVERLRFAAEWLEHNDLLAHFEQLRSAAQTDKIEVAVDAGAAVLVDDDPRHLSPEAPSHLRLILLSPGLVPMLVPTRGSNRCNPGPRS